MRNAWANKNAEIEKLRREITELRMRPTVQEFADRLCNSIGVILATMPFEKWPEIAKMAFRHEQGKTPTSAHFYRDRLPK